MRFFNTDFSATMQAGIIIFSVLVHSCCTMGLRISLLLLILPCTVFDFLSLFTLNNAIFVTDSTETSYGRMFISGLLFLPSIFVHY